MNPPDTVACAQCWTPFVDETEGYGVCENCGREYCALCLSQMRSRIHQHRQAYYAEVAAARKERFIKVNGKPCNPLVPEELAQIEAKYNPIGLEAGYVPRCSACTHVEQVRTIFDSLETMQFLMRRAGLNQAQVYDAMHAEMRQLMASDRALLEALKELRLGQSAEAPSGAATQAHLDHGPVVSAAKRVDTTTADPLLVHEQTQ